MRITKAPLALLVGVLALLLPLAVFAAGTSTLTVVVPEKPASGLVQIGLSVWEWLSPAFLAILAWVAKTVNGLINARITNTTIAGALSRLDWAVINAVKSVQQTLVEDIRKAKDPSSPGGAAITEGEAAQIKEHAIAQAKSFLGAKGVAELLTAFGVDEGSLNTMLGQRVEAAVHDLKATPASAPSPQ